MNKNEKTKKIISGALIATTLATAGGVVGYEYNKDVEFRRDVNKFLSYTFFGVNYSVPNGNKYSDFDLEKNTYYVHKNDVRTIVSTKESVEGYTCLGIYNSKSSAEELFYISLSMDNGETINYATISYDGIENDNKKVFEYVEDFALIDENSPEEVSAFVPACSIVEIDNTKTLTKKAK